MTEEEIAAKIMSAYPKMGKLNKAVDQFSICLSSRAAELTIILG